VQYGVDTRASKPYDMFLVCLYVDDLLITRSNEREINKFKGCMMAEFEMSNLGELT